MTSPPLRRRDARHRWETQVGPSMTPMVDVTLVILIFFMASAAFIGPEVLLATGLESRNESGRGGRLTLPDAVVEVRLDTAPDGRIVATGLGLENASLEQLADRLDELGQGVGSAASQSSADPTMTVIIDSAGSVPYGSVVRVRDLCEQSGLTRVVIR